MPTILNEEFYKAILFDQLKRLTYVEEVGIGVAEGKALSTKGAYKVVALLLLRLHRTEALLLGFLLLAQKFFE